MEPNRKSPRLTNYDYSRNGVYFITIVCQDREMRFGEIVKGKMVLNDAGKMVQFVWEDLPNRFPMIQLDSFVVMPNHIHGIIKIVSTDVHCAETDDDSIKNGFVENGQAQGQSLQGIRTSKTDDENIKNEHVGTPLVGVRPYNNDNDCSIKNGQAQGQSLRTVGEIIGAFKSITTNRYINGVKMGLVPSFRKRLWQHRFYDSIIRNERMYHNIREYIINNPRSWELDSLKKSDNELREDGAVYGDEWRSIC